LSTPIGDDCAGAVRFLNSEDNSRSQNREGAITWLSDDDVAERLRELRADSTDWLGRSFTGQFSLAGAQAKTALLYRDGRWGVPSGEIPTTHILKPAVSGLDDHDLNEHLCLDSANRAGLIAAQTTISTFAQETAVVVERYDRFIEATGTVKRVHQEDFCQALGIRPGRKYQNEGGPTPDDISRLLRDSMPSDVGENAIWRFADALAWNWIIGGTDAHSKNYSLLLAGRDVRFAPIYDVASALPYGSHEKKLSLAMKIGTSYDVYTRSNTWPGAAKALGLNAELLIQRVGDLARVAPDAFSDAARDPAVADLNRDLPGKLTDLVAERSSRCLSLLTRSAN